MKRKIFSFLLVFALVINFFPSLAYAEQEGEPSRPLKPGYIFGGWYKEEGCSNAWDFNNDIITQDTTLFAKWISNGTPFSGSGTQEDPYGISTPEQLDAVRNYLDAHFILLNDIDMYAATAPGGECNSDGLGWKPIGSWDIPFTGVFDGNGNRIYRLLIERDANVSVGSYIGLFGVIMNSNSEVKNLTLYNCTIKGYYVVGGIAGYLKGKITNCRFDGMVFATHYTVGGIAGEIEGDTGGRTQIDLCSNTGSIYGCAQTGGIAGVINNKCTLSRCYNSGNISGDDYIGGITGFLLDSNIEDCYSIGNIEGYDHTGSIVGFIEVYSLLKNCYSAGYLNGSINNIASGGIRGGTISNFYGLSLIPGDGKTLEEMRHQATYIGFNFNDTWEIIEGQRLPHLKNVPFVYTSGVSLSRETLNIDFSGPLKLTVAMIPSSATNKNVIWVSNDTSIASVLNGTVTAVSTGTTAITVTTIDGCYTDSCIITVSNSPVTVDIPDMNLKNSLLAAGMDENGDNQFSEYEMSSFTKNLDLSNKEISDLTGLEYATGIRKLDIGGNNIHNISILSNLTQLTDLEISGNPISDVSPVSYLINMEDLRICKNNINNLNCLSTLENLQVLIAQDNKLTSLDGIENLKHLASLQVGFNNIYDISAISGLKALTYVDLMANQISDISAFSGLSNISGLNLLANKISDLNALSGLINLKELDIGLNNLTDLNSMPVFSKLEYLNIFGNQLSDISRISVLSNLKSLSSASNQISDISALAGLNKLSYVDLRSNAICDISPIAGIQSITTMELQYNNITDITPLASCTNLHALYLDYNYLDVIVGSPQLETINTLRTQGVYLTYYPQFTVNIIFNDNNLKQGLVASGMDKDNNGEITVGEMYYYDSNLNLSNKNITDLTGLQYANELTWLDLSHNQIQNAVDLKKAFGLNYLDISYNSKVLDLDFLDQEYHINQIRTLNLKGTKLKDIGIISTIYYLENLDISNNSIEDIIPLVNNPNLKDLDIQYNYVDIYGQTAQLDAIQTMQNNGVNVQYNLQYHKLTGVRFAAKELQIIKGDTLIPQLVFSPEGLVNDNVTWGSYNTAIAEVDSSGKITAKNLGTTQIIVTTEDGGFKDTCTVKVSPRAFNITAVANNSDFGSLSGGGNYEEGSFVTLTATPKDGYYFVRWIDGSTSVCLSPQYSFYVEVNRTLKAEFAAIGIPEPEITPGLQYSVVLSWRLLPEASGYEVFRSTSLEGTYINIDTSWSTEYIDTSVVPGQSYFYKVRVFVASILKTYGNFSSVKSITLPTPSANLSGITISAGSLNRIFNTAVTSYTVNLGENDANITVTPIKAYYAATMTIDGFNVTNRTVSVANGKSVKIIIQVTLGRAKKTYKLTIKRAKSTNNYLSSLISSEVPLSPAFNKDITKYRVELPEGVDRTTITAAAELPTLAKVYYPKKTYILKNNQTKKVTIKVRSQAGKYKYYYVTIHRAPSSNTNLLSLKTSSSLCLLSPLFDAGTMDYKVTIPANISSIRIRSKQADRLSKVSTKVNINGITRTINRITLLNGQTATVEITVTAQSGTTKVYRIVVNRL